jgi:hypothetical protein
MFSVIFEVHPKSEAWDTCLAHGKALRPDLERMDGFADNISYRNLTPEGCILSLSGWLDAWCAARPGCRGRPSSEIRLRRRPQLDLSLPPGANPYGLQIASDAAAPPFGPAEQRS